MHPLSLLFPATLGISVLLYAASLARLLWSPDSSLELLFPWNPREGIEAPPPALPGGESLLGCWIQTSAGTCDYTLPAPPWLNIPFLHLHKGLEWFSDHSMKKAMIFLKKLISQVFLKESIALFMWYFLFRVKKERKEIYPYRAVSESYLGHDLCTQWPFIHGFTKSLSVTI